MIPANGCDTRLFPDGDRAGAVKCALALGHMGEHRSQEYHATHGFWRYQWRSDDRDLTAELRELVGDPYSYDHAWGVRSRDEQKLIIREVRKRLGRTTGVTE